MPACRSILEVVLMKQPSTKATALKFMPLIGVVSFFADITYEGSRSIVGPYLALFGASALVVAITSGFGMLLRYGLRVVWGQQSDRARKFWPNTIFGYLVQMLTAPLFALASNWQSAALLIIIQSIGRATGRSSYDIMPPLAAEVRKGWAFWVQKVLNQAGLLLGPLVVSIVLALRGEYRIAFAVLLIPALVGLSILVVAHLSYRQPAELEVIPLDVRSVGLPGAFWVCLQGTMLLAAGFVDFPLIAYHFARTSTVSSMLIPVFYVVAMGMSEMSSLIFERLFNRRGFSVLIPLTIISALFAPLVFLGNFWAALAGVALWGLGMGVHEAIIPAVVVLMVPEQRRASAYGLYTLSYGVFWFLGSALIGILYTISVREVVAFSLIAELVAVPLFLLVRQHVVR
jgi:MFS family permease